MQHLQHSCQLSGLAQMNAASYQRRGPLAPRTHTVSRMNSEPATYVMQPRPTAAQNSFDRRGFSAGGRDSERIR